MPWRRARTCLPPISIQHILKNLSSGAGLPVAASITLFGPTERPTAYIAVSTLAVVGEPSHVATAVLDRFDLVEITPTVVKRARSVQRQLAEPRIGASYLVPKSGTVRPRSRACLQMSAASE